MDKFVAACRVVIVGVLENTAGMDAVRRPAHDDIVRPRAFEFDQPERLLLPAYAIF